MYKVKITAHFSAAHFLRNYKGKCESLHGHNWKVEVTVRSSVLDSSGMVMDFSELKKIINGILQKLDHKHLNEVYYFGKINPSSEEIARYIFEQTVKKIEKPACSVDRVKVWETDNSCAIYSAEDK